MKLLASNKVVDSEYELAANDIRRIRTLMEDIDSQGIQFKYLITMNYPYRITDYTKVLYHSKHLKYVLQRNFDNPKVFITNEKHTSSKNIIDPTDKGIYDTQFYNSDGSLISLYGSIHRHIAVDVKGTNMRQLTAAIKTYCSKDFSYKRGGYDIRKVTNQENLMSYMTKDIDRPNLPNLGFERNMVIDFASSDIGFNHYSVSQDYRNKLENLYNSAARR